MMKKSGFAAVVLVGLAFVFIDLGVVLPVALKEMQAKAKSGGLDVFDFALLFVVITACIGKTIASYMNKGWTRYADQRDEDRKTETALMAKQASERDQAQRDFGGKQP